MDNKRKDGNKNNETKTHQKNILLANSFLLSSIYNFHPVHPLADKIFSFRDSCDETEQIFTDHLLSNLLSMVHYTLSHHHPRIVSRSTKYNEPMPKLQQPVYSENATCGDKNEVRLKSNKTRLVCKNAADFMETLFYDCHRGNLLEEFEKIVKYLTDAYFRPINPNQDKHCTKSPQLTRDPTANFDAHPLEETHKRLQEEYQSILFCQTEERHKLYNNYNKERAKSILNTLDIIKKQILETNRLAKEEYDTTMSRVRSNMLYNIETQQSKLKTLRERDFYCGGKGGVNNDYQTIHNVSGNVNDDNDNDNDNIGGYGDGEFYDDGDIGVLEDLKHFYKLEEFKSRVLLEVKSLEFVNNCEGAYVYMKYFLLATVAHEPDIAAEIGLLCDREKYSNFPLYLRFLFKEIENMPFNVRNSTFIVKDVVKAAAQYYTNGIVKRVMWKEFYSHPEYKR